MALGKEQTSIPIEEATLISAYKEHLPSPERSLMAAILFCMKNSIHENGEALNEEKRKMEWRGEKRHS